MLKVHSSQFRICFFLLFASNSLHGRINVYENSPTTTLMCMSKLFLLFFSAHIHCESCTPCHKLAPENRQFRIFHSLSTPLCFVSNSSPTGKMCSVSRAASSNDKWRDFMRENIENYLQKPIVCGFCCVASESESVGPTRY